MLGEVFVEQVMKKAAGKANPVEVNLVLKEGSLDIDVVRKTYYIWTPQAD